MKAMKAVRIVSHSRRVRTCLFMPLLGMPPHCMAGSARGACPPVHRGGVREEPQGERPRASGREAPIPQYIRICCLDASP